MPVHTDFRKSVLQEYAAANASFDLVHAMTDSIVTGRVVQSLGEGVPRIAIDAQVEKANVARAEVKRRYKKAFAACQSLPDDIADDPIESGGRLGETTKSSLIDGVVPC